MNKIIIKSISIKNLYGYAKADFTFDEKMNVIKAPTGTGKTSIINSILFALGFGKSNYQPTIDGYKIKDLESSVDLLLNANGLDYTLNVTSTQKWKVVDKESEKKELTGNELKYCFDGINCKFTDYKDKISSLFGMNYDVVEMLIDIKYFNDDTTKWKWNNRREFIFNLLDIDKKTAELAMDERFNLISTELRKGKTELEIQKILSTEKKGIEEEQKRNTIVIASKGEELTNLSSINYAELEAQKETIKQELDSLNTDNQELAVVKEKSRLNSELQELRLQLRQAQQNNDNAKYAYDNTIAKYQRDIASKERDLQLYNEKIKRIASDIEDCDIEISIEKDSVFDDSKAICPTCKRPLELDKVADLIAEFEKQKENNTVKLVARRSELALKSKEAQGLVDNLLDTINVLKNEMAGFVEKGYTVVDTVDIINALADKQKEIDNLAVDKVEIDNSQLKLDLSYKYENIIKQIAKKDRIAEIKNEIAELQANNRELAKKDSVRIQKANQLKDYILAKVELASTLVNANFDGVEFKLFSLNGALAENPIEPTCVVMLNGVEYDKQSNGQKIYSDICVGKALRKLLNVDLFMFIDEKQSMTLPYEVDCQVIELVTSTENNINAIKISDIYTINDTIKGE